MPIAIFMALPLIIVGGCTYVMLNNPDNFGLFSFGLDDNKKRR